MTREQVIHQIALKVCHCDGRIWLPYPATPSRRAVQERYTATATSILEMIEEYLASSVETTGGPKDFAPPHIRNARNGD